jgi:ankyrin repeat protein
MFVVLIFLLSLASVSFVKSADLQTSMDRRSSRCKGDLLIHNTRWGCLKAVQLLLEDDAPVDFKDKNGKTAVIHAVEKNHIDILIFLLQAKADPYIIDINYNIALDHALKAKNEIASQILRERSAQDFPECILS